MEEKTLKRKKRSRRAPSPTFSTVSCLTVAEFDVDGEQVPLTEPRDTAKKRKGARSNTTEVSSSHQGASPSVPVTDWALLPSDMEACSVTPVAEKSAGKTKKKNLSGDVGFSFGENEEKKNDNSTTATVVGTDEGGNDEMTGLVMTKDDDGKEEEEWMVEKVMRKKVYADGGVFYYIKWLDWSSDHNTWEPVEHLTNCKSLVEEYEKKLEERRQRAAAKKKKVQQSKGLPKRPPSPTMPILTPEVSMEAPAELQMERGHEDVSEVEEQMTESCGDDSSSEESENEKEEREIEKVTVDPMYRRVLAKHEIPLVILGSADINGGLHHLIRLRPATEEETEEVLKDPTKGLDATNCVVTPNSSRFQKKYRQLLAKYYDP